MCDSLFAKEATGFLLKKLLCRKHNLQLQRVNISLKIVVPEAQHPIVMS